MESFDEDTTRAKRPISLQTTTKGIATAVLADHWTMVERVPIDMQFAPWHPEKGSVTSLSYEAVVAINNAAKSEIQQDYNAQTNLDSMYFSGKGLAKFAMMIYATHDLARNPDLARTGLAKLKTAFAVFVQNKQKNPLV